MATASNADGYGIDAVFHVHSVSKVYRSGELSVFALRSVELDLNAGEFVVILGPSGSGKSTLLNILGGLDIPTSGDVRFRDHWLSEADDAGLTRFRREHVGFVFQLYNLILSLTALENVALVTEIAEHPMDPREALRLVGLTERQHHFPSQLSGGEQQRVAIARAVSKQPDILLCDEPTALAGQIRKFHNLSRSLDLGVSCNESEHRPLTGAGSGTVMRNRLACLFVLSAFCVPTFAVGFSGESSSEEQIIAQIETRAAVASDREQCYIYAELLNELVKYSANQYASGEVDRPIRLLSICKELRRRFAPCSAQILKSSRLRRYSYGARHTGLPICSTLPAMRTASWSRKR